MDFEAELEQLAALANPHERGRRFEELLTDLFTRSGFRASRNPAVAHPRQTDLFATYDDERYVVEAKWQTPPSDVSIVDDLWIRLQEIPAGTVGVLISVSGFTATAVERVLARRTHPILLVGRHELARSAADGELHAMLRRKLDALIRDRRADARPDGVPASADAPRAGPLPPSSRWFVGPHGARLPWLECPGGFSPTVFSPDLLGSTWTLGHDGGVALDIDLPAAGDDGVAGPVEALWRHGWLSNNAPWSIQQSDTNWHGAGPAELVEATAQRRQRYRGLSRVHGTEEVRIFDQFPGGLATFSADIAVEPRAAARSRTVSLRLEGVPFDGARLRRLVESLGASAQQLVYRPLRDHAISRARFDGDGTPLKPTGYVVEAGYDDGEPWVIAITVNNPHAGGHAIPTGGIPDARRLVRDSGVLVCALRDQHPLGAATREYRLTGEELTWTADTGCVRFVADW